MGYTFIKTCSKCDYYNQNRALNMKALTLPRSELSLMWQCTDSHKIGDLYHHNTLSTPYKPITTNKYNSYVTSRHGVSTGNHSSGKRVRLFEQTPSNQQIDVPSASSAETVASDAKRFRAERDLYLAELDVVRAYSSSATGSL
jgi:hypothetical protein